MASHAVHKVNLVHDFRHPSVAASRLPTPGFRPGKVQWPFCRPDFFSEIKPFDERVEGLSNCGDKSYGEECAVQLHHYEGFDVEDGDVRSRPGQFDIATATGVR